MNKYIRDENTGVFKQSVGTTGADQVVNNARSGRSVGYNPPEDRSLQQHLNGTDDTQSTYDMWSGMNPNIDDLVNQAYPQKHSVGSNIASMLAAAATGFAAGYTGDPSVYNNYMEELNYPKHQREQLRSSLIADQYKSQMPTSDMREFAAYAGKNIEPGSDDWQKLWDRFKHPTSEADLYYKYLGTKLRESALEKSDAGATIPAAQVSLLTEGQQLPNLFSKGLNTINENKNSIGPIAGLIGSINKYDTSAQDIQAQFNTLKQIAGKFMEGGVLRKEDEEKYKEILPKITDTPEVAANKSNQLRDLLTNRYNEWVNNLGNAGYNVKNFPKLGYANDLAGSSELLRKNAPQGWSGKTATATDGNTYYLDAKGNPIKIVE